MLSEIKEQLRIDRLLENQMVSIVPKVTPSDAKASRGVLRIIKTKFGAAFPARIQPLARMPRATTCSVENGVVKIDKPAAVLPTTDVYIIDDGTPGGTPLYGRFFLPGKGVAAEMARVIRNYALRANLQSLNNTVSTLPAQIAVTINEIPKVETVENCNNGVVERALKTRPSAADMRQVKTGKIGIGSVFNFKIKNISGDLRRKKDQYASGEPLFVTALYLLNNGDIDVIYPRLGAHDPLVDGMEKTIGGYVASSPGGAENLILIVSKQYVDFGFYDSATASRSPQSALERLLSQSGTRTRDAATLIPDEPDSWGVLRVDLDIGAPVK